MKLIKMVVVCVLAGVLVGCVAFAATMVVASRFWNENKVASAEKLWLQAVRESDDADGLARILSLYHGSQTPFGDAEQLAIRLRIDMLRGKSSEEDLVQKYCQTMQWLTCDADVARASTALLFEN